MEGNNPLQEPVRRHPQAPAATAPATAPAEVLSDYQQAQKKSDVVFWASIGIGVIVVLATIYLFHSQVIQPKQARYASIRSQATAAESSYQQNLKKSQSLPELQELLHVMNAKWEDVLAAQETQRHSWFFKGYWEVLDNMFQTLAETMIQSGVFPTELKATIYDVGNRTALFNIQWSPGHMRKIAGTWGIKKVQIGEAEDKLTGANLLNPIPFEGRCFGEYENIMRMVDRLFYDSPYFYALVSLKLSRRGTAATFGVFTPVGAIVEAEIKGAAFFINPDGNPTFDFGVEGAQMMPGGAAGGAGAGPRGRPMGPGGGPPGGGPPM